MVSGQVGEILVVVVGLEPEVLEVEPESLLLAAADEVVAHVLAVDDGQRGHGHREHQAEAGHVTRELSCRVRHVCAPT